MILQGHVTNNICLKHVFNLFKIKMKLNILIKRIEGEANITILKYIKELKEEC